jgi:uncharacterized protein (TIGR03084 family)
VADLESVLPDLETEGDELDRLVSPLSAAAWSTPTPAPGWTIAHQIAHLAWTDQAAVLAITDPATFRDAVLAEFAGSSAVDDAAEVGAQLPPPQLLSRWRTGRADLAAALRATDPGTRIGWLGPPMSPTSMATARFMETWAHGRDIANALGVQQPPTPRIRHVAHLGVRARNFAFAVHHEPAPEAEFRVALIAPDGGSWTWGPADAEDTVTGSALDFCLLATQRINRVDTDLQATGAAADRWLEIIQAFAGPPGPGREATSAVPPNSGPA